MAMEKHHRVKPKNAVVVPAMMVAISLMVLVAVMRYVNADLRYGTGYSALLFASFGASAFLLFMVPRANTARVSRFIKSYAMGGALGVLGYYVLLYFGTYVAVGLIMFLTSVVLVKTDSMHPPAMGIVFAFILYQVDYEGVLIVALGVITMILIRVVLEKAAFIIEKDFEEVERDIMNRRHR